MIIVKVTLVAGNIWDSLEVAGQNILDGAGHATVDVIRHRSLQFPVVAFVFSVV